ncbi:MAG: hypothetical protein U0903_16760 [Planctomycetales bacterium]
MSRGQTQSIPDRAAVTTSGNAVEIVRSTLGLSCASGLVLWSFLLSAGLICLLRRVSGAYHYPLSLVHAAELWLLCGGCLYIAVTRCEETLRRVCKGQRQVAAILGTVPLWFWVLAFMPVKSLMGISLGLVFIVGLIEILLRPERLRAGLSWLRGEGQRIHAAIFRQQPESAGESMPPQPARSVGLRIASEEETANDSLPPGTLQTFARRVEGTEEILTGNLVAEFLPTERLRILHVSFCPPFDHVPEVEIHCDDSAIRATVAIKYSHGMRIEVRRLGGTAAQQTHVHFAARASRENA